MRKLIGGTGLTALCLSAIILASSAGEPMADAVNSEKDNVRLAETAIQYQLAVWNTPARSIGGVENKYSYIGVPAWELAIALISARDTPYSLEALARLLRYKTDAGMSESINCAILSKGKIIEPYLAEISAEDLQAQCTSEMAELAKRTKGKFSDRISLVACQSQTEVGRKVDAFLNSISEGDRCE